jgi:hypothetical protein
LRIGVLRRIFGPKGDEVKGEWRNLHNEELNNLHSSPDIVRVIKLRRMRRAGHVARRGKREVYTGFWWGKVRERNHVDIINMDLQEVGCGVWNGSSWLRIGTGGGHL